MEQINVVIDTEKKKAFKDKLNLSGITITDFFNQKIDVELSDKLDLKNILIAVSLETVINIDVIKSKLSTKDVAYARHLFCYFGFNYTENTLKLIGLYVGKTTASVIYGRNIIDGRYNLIKPITRDVDNIKKRLGYDKNRT